MSNSDLGIEEILQQIGQRERALATKRQKEMERQAAQKQILAELERDFGLKSIEEAEAYIRENTERVSSRTQKIQEKMTEFQEKYDEQLGVNDAY